jgi:hypothetical protein
MAYSVFVSHGWDDRWVALQIANNIRSRAGADVSIDMFDIQSGDRIEEKVHEGITGCNELISLLTPRSVRRNWVWAEIAGAWILRKRYVAVIYGLTREEIDKAHGGLGDARVNKRERHKRFGEILDRASWSGKGCST